MKMDNAHYATPNPSSQMFDVHVLRGGNSLSVYRTIAYFRKRIRTRLEQALPVGIAVNSEHSGSRSSTVKSSMAHSPPLWKRERQRSPRGHLRRCSTRSGESRARTAMCRPRLLSHRRRRAFAGRQAWMTRRGRSPAGDTTAIPNMFISPCGEPFQTARQIQRSDRPRGREHHDGKIDRRVRQRRRRRQRPTSMVIDHLSRCRRSGLRRAIKSGRSRTG